MKTSKSKAKKPPKEGDIDVRNFIVVEMIFSGDKTTGWVHTHGMWEVFGLPDLEIINVNPLFLMPEAGIMLNHIAQYMVDGASGKNEAKPVKVGETFAFGPMQMVKFEISTPLNPDDKQENDLHFVKPRWRVSPVPEQYKCVMCDNEEHKHGKPS